ncbi:UNVERIFIED_CONTAM: hypothetical protein K2H54_055963 [Gekko kuhli]
MSSAYKILKEKLSKDIDYLISKESQVKSQITELGLLMKETEMSSENPTDTQPQAPPPVSETSTSTLPICPVLASDVSTPSKRTAPKDSSASTPAKKKKEHEKEKLIPKKAAHKSHSMSGTGKQVGSALPPLQQAQYDIVAPPELELMVLPPIKLIDLPIQQLSPLVLETFVAACPKFPLEVEEVVPHRHSRDCSPSVTSWASG